MIVETIAVGTELLLGQIVNSNASDIGARLAEVGIGHYRQTVVGDNVARIAAALREALDRSDCVIMTGGLGPTQDDLTREAIREVAGVGMSFSDDQAEEIRRMFELRGREMPETNLRQAEYPTGAELIANSKGTAPGLKMQVQGSWVFALPGVPQEMIPMLEGTVIPFLTAQTEGGVITSRLLRTWGESESRVASLVGDLFDVAENPTIAFLASGGEIKLRITARAATTVEADRLIAPVEAELRARLGRLVFGTGPDTVERIVLRACEERGWSIATAESATGGLVCAALTAVPGASRVVRGAVVPYAADVKVSALGLSDEMVSAGVVREEVAMAMASGARSALGADVAVAVTGSAGPDELEQPSGTMIFAVETPESARARTMRLPGDRERVRTFATTAALHLTRLAVSGEWWR